MESDGAGNPDVVLSIVSVKYHGYCNGIVSQIQIVKMGYQNSPYLPHPLLVDCPSCFLNYIKTNNRKIIYAIGNVCIETSLF